MGVAKAVISVLLALVGQSAGAAVPGYAEGQVWEYRTRPSDAGSLLKIRRIEPLANNSKGVLVYHISVIGVDLGPTASAGVLQHMPVSRETLDASVTGIADSDADFGDVDEGIAEWRRAEGGVFNIPVADIVGLIGDMTDDARPDGD